MLRLTKQADYGIILLSGMARGKKDEVFNARKLADTTRIPRPMVTKILKILVKEGLLTSRHGAQGGYRLARDPRTVSLTEIIQALEGPIALTVCGVDGGKSCAISELCPTRSHWNLIGEAIAGALGSVMLGDMSRPLTKRNFSRRLQSSLDKQGRGSSRARSRPGEEERG